MKNLGCSRSNSMLFTERAGGGGVARTGFRVFCSFDCLLFRLSDRQSKERVEVRAHLHFHTHACLCPYAVVHIATLFNHGQVHASHAPTSNVHELCMHAYVTGRKGARGSAAAADGSLPTGAATQDDGGRRAQDSGTC